LLDIERNAVIQGKLHTSSSEWIKINAQIGRKEVDETQKKKEKLQLGPEQVRHPNSHYITIC
jgi:hypothetical protein